jgi:hypothetical protein
MFEAYYEFVLAKHHLETRRFGLVQRGPRRMVWHHLHRAVFESEWISHCENVGVMPNARILLQGLSTGCGQRAQRALAANLEAVVNSNARLDRADVHVVVALSVTGYVRARVAVHASLPTDTIIHPAF